MIKITDVSKSYGDIQAVSHLTLALQDEQVFGLVGTNGAGKSTLLRMLSGIIRQDEGIINIDGYEVYDNPDAKNLFYFIPDEPWFFPNSTAIDLKQYLETVYPNYRGDRFLQLMKDLDLDPKRRISTFSKGMKKQLAIIAGISAGTKYLFLDETFDGLDPVMRQGVKSLFAGEMSERGLTPVIASHNLRELEDICDHVGLLHQGGLLLSEDLADLKLGILKLQCVFENENDAPSALQGLRVLSSESRGRLHTLVISGTREELEAHFQHVPMVFFELLPLSLEEIFISETEVAGYDIKKLIYG